MIFFHFSTISPTSVITLSLLLLCFLVSLFLNPSVFIYNRRKSSIAGTLYCIISATDFLVCLFVPSTVIYYASTVRLEHLDCKGKPPQNCFGDPSVVNMITTLIYSSLNLAVFITTGVLAVVRSVQIIYPFYPIKKRTVLSVLIALVAIQITMYTILMALPSQNMNFNAASFMIFPSDPNNLKSDEQQLQLIISVMIGNSAVTLVQLMAVIACILTAIFLFQQRNSNCQGPSNEDRRRSRLISAVKVMMTNLMSFIMVIILGTPVCYYMNKNSYMGDIMSDSNGWLQFWFVSLFPVLSSVWNPVVFLSFTPKSRAPYRSLISGCGVHRIFCKDAG